MRKRGFTLLELSTVVALISIVVAIVVPQVVHLRSAQDARLSVVRVRDLFRYCSAEAPKRKAALVLRYDEPTKTFTASVDDGNDEQTRGQGAAQPTAVKSFQLPDGVTAPALRAGDQDPQSAQWELRFYPDGSADGGGVQLSETGKDSAVVVDKKGHVEIQDGALPDQRQSDWKAGDYERRQ